MAGKYHLLIVDDDPLNTQTLSEIFTLNGYQVSTTNSGMDALKMLAIKRYDCILSDIKMNQMNGVELLRAVKALHRGIPFILMTAYSDTDLIMQGIKEGALVTLIKPLNIDSLLGHIAVILKA